MSKDYLSLFATIASLFLATCSVSPESKTVEGGGLNLEDVIVMNAGMWGYHDFSTRVQICYRRSDGTQLPSLPFFVDSYVKGPISASEGFVLVRRKVEIQPGQLGERTSAPNEYIEGPVGYVNLAGQQMIPFQYKWAGNFHQGRAVAATEKGTGLIDKAGNWIVPPGKYHWICSGSEGRWAFQKKDEDGKWGFLNLHGKQVIPPRFKPPTRLGFNVPMFSEGLAVVTDENDRIIAIDMNGNTQFAFPEKTNNAHPFSEGLALFSIYLPGEDVPYKIGFISTTGHVMIPADDRAAWDFSEGLAPASFNAKVGFRPSHHEYHKDDKWGYIDATGKIRIPFQFTQVGKFSNGLAAVMLDGKWGYINKAGEMVIPCQFQWAADFNRGIAQIWHNGEICFINDQGHFIARSGVEWAIF